MQLKAALMLIYGRQPAWMKLWNLVCLSQVYREGGDIAGPNKKNLSAAASVSLGRVVRIGMSECFDHVGTIGWSSQS